jgi:hypothetical protein
MPVDTIERSWLLSQPSPLILKINNDNQSPKGMNRADS